MNYYEKEPVSLYLEDLKQLESFQSPKQHIQLFEHPWLGKVLIHDGEIQHIEKFQPLYHELLVHLPAAFIPNVETALILGGGSLFAAYEVLKYPSVQNVTLCDYDHSVLELMCKYYSHARTVITDPRFHYIEKDGREFIRNHHELYDLVINDCFNLAKESNQEKISYFTMLSNLCTSSGVCVDIIYRHIFDKQITADSLTYLKREKNLALALVTVPEYPGILHVETIWGNSPLLKQKCNASVNRFQLEVTDGDIHSPFIFFNPSLIPFYLYLPPYVKEMFSL